MSEHHDPNHHDDRSADGARLQDENDGAPLAPGGEPGVKDDHPIGTTAGTGTGATIGAVVGAAVAGPAGAVVGGIVGGVIGGGAGHGIADAVTGDDDRTVGRDELRDHDDLSTERRPEDLPPVERPLLQDDVATSPVEEDRRLDRP
jgi:hypothetical protein